MTRPQRTKSRRARDVTRRRPKNRRQPAGEPGPHRGRREPSEAVGPVSQPGSQRSGQTAIERDPTGCRCNRARALEQRRPGVPRWRLQANEDGGGGINNNSLFLVNSLERIRYRRAVAALRVTSSGADQQGQERQQLGLLVHNRKLAALRRTAKASELNEEE